MDSFHFVFITPLCCRRTITDPTMVLQKRQFIVLAATLAIVAGGSSDMGNVLSECDSKELVYCLELNAVKLLNQALQYDKWPISRTVVLERVRQEFPNYTEQRTFLSRNLESYLSKDVQRRSKLVQELLFNRLRAVFTSRALKVDLEPFVPGATMSVQRADGTSKGVDFKFRILDADKATETARGSMKKLMIPLLLGLKMKAATLIPIALMALALLAGKALLVGKIALMLAIIIGLKKLASSQKSSVSYEIVPHPHHGPSRKSMDVSDPHKLAYSGYIGQPNGK